MKAEASNEGAAVCFLGWRDALFEKFAFDPSIDGLAAADVDLRGNGQGGERLPAPPLGALCGDRFPLSIGVRSLADGCHGLGGFARVECTLFDPMTEFRDVRIIEFGGFGRHFQARFPMSDRADQKAFIRFPGNDRRARVTSFHPACSAIESQAAVWFFLVVAGQAMLMQGGSDIGFEELVLRSLCWRVRGIWWWSALARRLTEKSAGC